MCPTKPYVCQQWMRRRRSARREIGKDHEEDGDEHEEERMRIRKDSETVELSYLSNPQSKGHQVQ